MLKKKIHPLRFDKSLWTCRPCDCECQKDDKKESKGEKEEPKEEEVTTFRLRARCNFPVSDGFACYEVLLREEGSEEPLVVACPCAKLAPREFSAKVAVARVPKATAKQLTDLRKTTSRDWLAPGTTQESDFFAALDKLTKGNEAQRRRQALSHATQAQLEMMLYLYTLGFDGEAIARSFRRFRRFRWESAESFRDVSVWTSEGNMQPPTADRLRRRVEACVRRNPEHFFNEETRSSHMQELGPIALEAFTLGSARALIEEKQSRERPMVEISAGFEMGTLERAFKSAPPGVDELRRGESGIVGPCLEADGLYMSRSLAACYGELSRLHDAGFARLSEEVEHATTCSDVYSEHAVVHNANVMTSRELLRVLERLRDASIVCNLQSLTLTAPFDFDDDMNTPEWRLLRKIFQESREDVDSKSKVKERKTKTPAKSEKADKTEKGEKTDKTEKADKTEKGEKKCNGVEKTKSEKSNTDLSFAMVSTCEEARRKKGGGFWGFFPREMTLVRKSSDSYERVLSNKPISRGDVIYSCEEREGDVLVPVCCVAGLPDRCIPISRVFLPADDEKATRVMTIMANRVSSVAVDFVRL